jgi:hypothetical protein
VFQDHTFGADGSTKVVVNQTDCDRGEGSISGIKFSDLNGNGIRDEGDNALSGWTIYLDLNDNGSKDSGEPSVVTDQSGAYSFSGLTPGIYVVREVPQGGWVQTFPGLSDGFKHVVAISGTPVSGQNFGNHHTQACEVECGGGGDQLGSIAGQVFNDQNDNNGKDSGEPGLSGWTVRLEQGANTTTTLTDANGNYSFTNLPDGEYKVCQEVQSGWTETFPTVGVPCSPILGYDITIAGANAVTDRDFGNFLSDQGGCGNDCGGGGGGGSFFTSALSFSIKLFFGAPICSL